jgi:hypothetical protein
VFACGATTWLGRKLQVEKLKAANSERANLQPSTFDLQPIAKEAA